jgi:hypothetical protein
MHKLEAGKSDVNSTIDDLSKVFFDKSFKLHGKTFSIKPKNNVKKKSVWFDSNCKHAKNYFYCDKRAFKAVLSDENRARCLENIILILRGRQEETFVILKQNKLSNLSKRYARQFWKYINKFKNKSKADSSDYSIHEYVEYFKSLSILNQSDSVIR